MIQVNSVLLIDGGIHRIIHVGGFKDCFCCSWKLFLVFSGMLLNCVLGFKWCRLFAKDDSFELINFRFSFCIQVPPQETEVLAIWGSDLNFVVEGNSFVFSRCVKHNSCFGCLSLWTEDWKMRKKPSRNPFHFVVWQLSDVPLLNIRRNRCLVVLCHFWVLQ